MSWIEQTLADFGRHGRVVEKAVGIAERHVRIGDECADQLEPVIVIVRALEDQLQALLHIARDKPSLDQQAAVHDADGRRVRCPIAGE